MKCPLLKITETGSGKPFINAHAVITSFRSCIEHECMAWDKKRKTCNHFNPDNKKIVESKL